MRTTYYVVRTIYYVMRTTKLCRAHDIIHQGYRMHRTTTINLWKKISLKCVFVRFRGLFPPLPVASRVPKIRVLFSPSQSFLTPKMGFLPLSFLELFSPEVGKKSPIFF